MDAASPALPLWTQFAPSTIEFRCGPGASSPMIAMREPSGETVQLSGFRANLKSSWRLGETGSKLEKTYSLPSGLDSAITHAEPEGRVQLKFNIPVPSKITCGGPPAKGTRINRD